MAVNAATVVIGTAAVALNRPETDGNVGQSISVQNLGTVTVYLGGSNVTAASCGVALAQDAVYSADLQPGDVLYAISAGSANVNVLGLHA